MLEFVTTCRETFWNISTGFLENEHLPFHFLSYEALTQSCGKHNGNPSRTEVLQVSIDVENIEDYVQNSKLCSRHE